MREIRDVRALRETCERVRMRVERRTIYSERCICHRRDNYQAGEYIFDNQKDKQEVEEEEESAAAKSS